MVLEIHLFLVWLQFYATRRKIAKNQFKGMGSMNSGKQEPNPCLKCNDMSSIFW